MRTAPRHADLIEHHPACHHPEPMEYYDRTRGGVVTRCRSCSRRVRHTDVAPSAIRLTIDSRVSNYRCRVHLDQPVTWRGKGCTACAREHAKANQKPLPKPWDNQ